MKPGPYKKLTLPVNWKLDIKLHFETHLAACERCRSAIEESTYSGLLIRENALVYKAPSGLRERVQKELRREFD